MPEKPQDQFQGAEQDIQRQQREALRAVAQFGRRGLEQGVLAARRLRDQAFSDRAGIQALQSDFRVPAGMARELNSDLADAYRPFVDDANLAQSQFRNEIKAMEKVNSTFFQQGREAVPALRAQGEQITEQYRQAYEERQAQIRAEAEQRAEQQRQMAAQLALREREMALQAQIASQRLAADQQIAAANLAAMQASRPVYTPSYSPPPPPARKPATRIRNRSVDMERSRRMGR